MRSGVMVLLLGVMLGLSGCYIVPMEKKQAVKNPVVDWKPVVIRAIGQGAPPARSVNAAQARIMTERAAKLDAYRNLLEESYGVNISSRTNVRDFILKNDSIKARVDAYIRGAKVVHTIYHDDGGVEVEMEVTLRQDFRRIFD
jgi:hypothetical protein